MGCSLSPLGPEETALLEEIRIHGVLSAKRDRRVEEITDQLFVAMRRRGEGDAHAVYNELHVRW